MHIKSFFGYFDPNWCYYCRVVYGHGMLELSIWGLMLWDNCWIVYNADFRSRKENGRSRITGAGTCAQLSVSRRSSDGYLSFLVKKSICNPQGGMEDVCRVVIAMHDLMGLEFSLSNQMNATFWVGVPERVGLFTHTKATMTCECPFPITQSSLYFIKVTMTQTVWLLKMIALVGIKLCLIWAESCDQVAGQWSCFCQQSCSWPTNSAGK